MASNMDTVGTFEMAIALNKVRLDNNIHPLTRSNEKQINFSSYVAQLFHNNPQTLSSRRMG